MKEPSREALLSSLGFGVLIFAAAYEHLDSLIPIFTSFAFLVLGYRMGLPVPPPELVPAAAKR